MTATTPRYQLEYPTADDLVADAPAQFKAIAESVESALGEVDDRQTANAVKPVVRPTLAELNQTSGVTGQTGIAEDDDLIRRGQYTWLEHKWSNTAVRDITSMLNITSQYWTVNYKKLLLIDHSMVLLTLNLTRKGVDWTAGGAWASSALGSITGLKFPIELHVPTVSSASSPSSILLQAIDGQLAFRKPAVSDQISVGAWLQASALLPIVAD